MALIRPTIDQIYQRIKADMEARVSSNTPILRFSILGIINSVFTGAIHLVYGYVENISRQLFPDTATGEFLDRWANLYGLPRKAATFAAGTVQFTGTDGTPILEGTQVQNSEGLTYSTLSEVLITGGIATVDVQADESGEASNTEETVLSLSFPISGVDTEVQAPIPPDGGQEKETDEALRARLLQRLQNPPSSGTAADYERWALEVDGVGKAWTLPAEEYAGAGTVASVIATVNLEVVAPSVKDAAQIYIDTVRPVGAQADVLNLEPLATEYDIDLNPNTQEIRDNVDKNLNDLHLAEASPGGILYLSHIRSAIASSGVIDYEITDIRLAGFSIGVTNIQTTGLKTPVYDFFNAGTL